MQVLVYFSLMSRLFEREALTLTFIANMYFELENITKQNAAALFLSKIFERTRQL